MSTYIVSAQPNLAAKHFDACARQSVVVARSAAALFAAARIRAAAKRGGCWLMQT